MKIFNVVENFIGGDVYITSYKTLKEAKAHFKEMLDDRSEDSEFSKEEMETFIKDSYFLCPTNEDYSIEIVTSTIK